MPKIVKFFIPFFVLLTVILYSIYLKKGLDSSSSESGFSDSVVIRNMPTFEVYDLEGKKISSSVLLNQNGSYVHIWGTWCGPCESEFGVLLDFAAGLENKNVKFYLIAVNDEKNKILKFISKYKKIPNNVSILIDQDNQVMDKFGTFKVPETFLFDSKGVGRNKYVGPQDWSKEIYKTQLSNLINN